MNAGESPASWKTRHWRESVWIALVTMAVGIVLALLSRHTPLSDAVKGAVTRIYMPIATLFYPSSGQNAITIVTIDDIDLDIFGVSWPLQLGFLARRTDAMLTLAPKVLFIDLLLKAESPRSDIETFKNVLCKHARRTHVFIATAGGPELYSETEKILFNARTPTSEDDPPDWNEPPPCARPVDVRIDTDELDQLQWKYPMRDTGREDDGRIDPGTPSAALSIFCDQFSSRCPDDATTPLALVWPTTSFESNFKTMIRPRSTTAQGVIAASDSPYEHLCRQGTLAHDFHAVALEPIGATSKDEDSRLRKLLPCPYSRVVSLRAFNGYGFASPELRGAFAGKIVMLGAQITGTGDTVVSPINGRLPGVHVHAMALDNLISFEGKYKEHGESDVDRPSAHANLFVLGGIVSFVTVLVLWHHFFTARSQPETRPLELPPARHFTGRRLLAHRVLMTVVGLYGVIRGRELLQPVAQSRVMLLVRTSFYVVQGVLIGVLFFVGYVFLRQGPLSIAEYLLFPLVANLLHLGEPIAQRAQVLFRALNTHDPVHAWCQGLNDLKKKNMDGR